MSNETREPELGRVQGAAIGFGMILSLISTELGRALAVLGGILVGCQATSMAFSRHEQTWQLFLVAGATFTAIAWTCSRR